MKTSKLLSLASGLILLSSTVFAGKVITGNLNNDTTWSFASVEYSEWDYTNDPLQEVLEMDAIPMIYVFELTKSTEFKNADEEYIDPLNEVLSMEAIPVILDNSLCSVTLSSKIDILDTLEKEYNNPLEEVLEMERIPTIYQSRVEESSLNVGL